MPLLNVYHLCEVSIMLQLCTTCFTAIQIKNCSKSTSVIKVATMKNTDGAACHKVKYLLRFFVSSVNQELLKKAPL